MNHVLISYSRVDSDHAQALVQGLLTMGIEAWIDQRDIPCSVPWFEEIQASIRSSRAMVVIDTPAWHASDYCAAELSEAVAWQVQVIYLEKSQSPDVRRDIDDVVAALSAQSLVARNATELRTAAHEWDQRGRPRTLLVRGSRLRDLRSVPSEMWLPRPDVVSSFVRRSLRGQRQRRLVRGFLAAALVLSFGVVAVVNETKKRAETGFASSIAGSTIQSLSRSVGVRSPFAALDLAVRAYNEGHNEYFTRNALVEALRRRTPVSSTRAVSADKAPAGMQSRQVVRRGGFAASFEPGGHRVEIRRGGQLLRTLMLRGRISSAAFSPGGEAIAVAASNEILQFDLESGSITQTLQGSPDELVTVSWPREGTQLMATDVRGRRLAWEVSPGSEIPAPAGRWYVAASLLPGTSRVALLSRDGTVDIADTDQRQILLTTKAATGPTVRLATSPLGQIGVLSPSTGVAHLLDGAGKDTGRIPLTGCTANDLAFDRSGHLVVACEEGILLVDLTTGAHVKLGLDGAGAWSVAVAGEGLVIGTTDGALAQLEADGSIRWNSQSLTCPGSIRWLAAAPDRAVVFNAGAGSGTQFCAFRISLQDGPIDVDHMVSGVDVSSTQAVAVSPDGSLVARGAPDGSVSVADTHSLSLRDRISGLPGPVRGLAFDQDSRRIVAVTQSGRAFVLNPPWAGKDLSELARAAEQRLRRAIAAGLYNPPPSGPPAD